MTPIVGYAGLTHLGLCSAAAAAARGFTVIGFHDDADLIRTIETGVYPISEPNFAETVAVNRARLSFTADAQALRTCDIVYISVDVPTDESGASNIAPIHAMIKTVAAVLRDDALLVILCQVQPGFTRALTRNPAHLYYQVETLVFGNAMERALHPERFMVGCADSAQPLDARLAAFLAAFDCPILPMRYESAELAKISINMCLVASVSVANTMAELCEHIGADWSEIVPALKLDRRIGAYSYLAPGLGIAGGNLERDLETVMTLARRHGTDGGVPAAWVANSNHRKGWAWQALQRRGFGDGSAARIGVLGLAYKENTASTKNSPSLALLKHLGGRAVTVHDPVVGADKAGIKVTAAKAPLDVADGADIVAIMTPWPVYRDLAPADLARRMAGRLVLDPYRVLKAEHVRGAGLDYVTLGAADA
jgi:UDPglucose 6-dehydrogenase